MASRARGFVRFRRISSANSGALRGVPAISRTAPRTLNPKPLNAQKGTVMYRTDHSGLAGLLGGSIVRLESPNFSTLNPINPKS